MGRAPVTAVSFRSVSTWDTTFSCFGFCLFFYFLFFPDPSLLDDPRIHAQSYKHVSLGDFIQSRAFKKKKSSIHQDKVAAYKQAPLQGAAGKTSVQREPTVATWDLWFQQDLKFPPKNPAKTVLCNHEAKNTFK